MGIAEIAQHSEREVLSSIVFYCSSQSFAGTQVSVIKSVSCVLSNVNHSVYIVCSLVQYVIHSELSFMSTQLLTRKIADRLLTSGTHYTDQLRKYLLTAHRRHTPGFSFVRGNGIDKHSPLHFFLY
jgi:hypothetical protein